MLKNISHCKALHSERDRDRVSESESWERVRERATTVTVIQKYHKYTFSVRLQLENYIQIRPLINTSRVLRPSHGRPKLDFTLHFYFQVFLKRLNAREVT